MDKRVTKTAAAGSAPELSPADLKLPPQMFSPLGVLALADALPVMTAYVDREERYRFLNKPLADWFERPRSEILGRTLEEVLGEAAYAVRAPLIAAALAGERQYFASDFDHPTRGPLAVQTNYVPWVEARRGAGGGDRRRRRHRAARDRAGVARERGAVPADRQFGAGDDVGDPARPHPRLRQRRLCGVRRRAAARRPASSTGGPGSTPTTSTGSSPRASPARRA